MIDGEASARRYVAGLCDANALERLESLERALLDENDRQNLVSRGTLGSVWLRHFADSAQLLELAKTGGETWLDLGTGAGFPGLVVAAMQPEMSVVLVESRRKRSDWLLRMRDELGLSNCRVEGRRLELVESFPASIISARAFAPMPRLLELAKRFSTKDTLWLLPKGRSAEQELRKLPIAVQPMFHVEPSRTDPDARILIGKEANRA